MDLRSRAVAFSQPVCTRAFERLWLRGPGQAAAGSGCCQLSNVLSGALMSATGGFPSPVVKAKVAHWSAGIKQGMMALPPPWFFLCELFPLILWKKGKLSQQVFVEEGRRT